MPETRLDRCPTCRAADVDQRHADRCKLLDDTKSAALAHGRQEHVMIHAAKTHDLWATVHTITGDPAAARDVVMRVIDLGWRPVVGKYDLWTKPTATPDHPDTLPNERSGS